MKALLASFALFCAIASADVCSVGSGAAYAAGSGSCTEGGFAVQYQILSLGVNLADLIVTPYATGNVRGFDITSDGAALTGDYVFNFAMTPIGAGKITSFTETVSGGGIGIVDTGFACDAHNSCNYFNLHSAGSNTVTYAYSPGSVDFSSHEDVGVIRGGQYGGVDKSLTVTPEPGTVGLIGIGLLGLGFFKRKRIAA